MEFFENLTTPVSYECDVLVAGGGFGGIAAAIAAARENKKVILLKRQFLSGVLAEKLLLDLSVNVLYGT